MGLSYLWQLSRNQWCMIKHGEQNRNKVFKCELFKNAIIMLGHIQCIMFKYVLTRKCVA